MREEEIQQTSMIYFTVVHDVQLHNFPDYQLMI